MTMTAEQAKTFEGYSVSNATSAEEAFPCCEAYVDIFTYARWQAQGMQVMKGQKGTKVPTMTKRKIEDDDGEEKFISFRSMSSLFCRHQVVEK
tara:strand:+ start:1052 stop:1330 length:279 start_codon:yes stop_codon:yes gene_type:complete